MRALRWMLCQLIGHDRRRAAGKWSTVTLCTRCGQLRRTVRFPEEVRQ